MKSHFDCGGSEGPGFRSQLGDALTGKKSLLSTRLDLNTALEAAELNQHSTSK